MAKTTATTVETSSSISIFRLVFIQSVVTLVGFVLLFGLCTKQVLRYQFSKVTEVQLQELSVHQRALASQQQVYVEASFLEVLDRVCVSIGCSIEDLTSEVVNDPPLQKQSVRIIATTDMFNVPILLDVLRAHPYTFSLNGLEVHALEKPVKVQFRLSRTLLPQDISEPDWVTSLGWTESEQVRIRALYGSWLTSKWSERFNEENRRSIVDWATLYGTLNKDLWNVYRQRGTLIYTPENGVVLRFAE